MADENDTLLEALRNARPSWDASDRPSPSLLDYKPVVLPPSIWGTASAHAAEQIPFPPPTETTTATTTTTDTSASTNIYGFQLDVDSIDQDAYTIDILVHYGEINFVPPTGMTDVDNYVFTMPGANDGTEVWAEITYVISSLEIINRVLNYGLVLPDSTIGSTTGTLIVPIGFIDIDYGDGGVIATVTPRNRHCGDINVGLMYGDVNGKPGLFFLNQLDDPLQLV